MGYSIERIPGEKKREQIKFHVVNTIDAIKIPALKFDPSYGNLVILSEENLF